MSTATTEGGYVPLGYVQDTNQALFDLKVDMARVEDSVLSTIRTEIRGAERRLTERLDGHDARFEGLETRLDGHDARFDALEERMDRLETRMDGLEERMDRLETGMERVESKLDLVLEQLAARG